MKFTVQFVSGDPSGNTKILDWQYDYGPEMLDDIRQQLGLPDLPAALLNTGWQNETVLHATVSKTDRHEISEDVARRSGHYEHAHSVIVIVDDIHDFSSWIAVADRAADGAVRSCNVKLSIDFADLVRQWENAGFPLNWVRL